MLRGEQVDKLIHDLDEKGGVNIGENEFLEAKFSRELNNKRNNLHDKEKFCDFPTSTINNSKP